ncbi:hypothetical protein MTO96_042542 [Rhipicephalus appendiculatus]
MRASLVDMLMSSHSMSVYVFSLHNLGSRRAMNVYDIRCYADLGHVGGQQVLSLGTRCLSTGIVLHELMHTLGFYDEHTRPDRDNYVVMHLNNVIPEFRDALERILISENRVGSPFDYDSVMLYGSNAFARHPGLRSIEAKDGRILTDVYDKHGLSSGDITRIRTLYRC